MSLPGTTSDHNGRSVPQIESAKGEASKTVKPATVEEELNDEIPWR
jgi:hypothetical protein